MIAKSEFERIWLARGEYGRIRVERARKRKEKRKEERKYNKNRNKRKTCEHCGGEMTWCDGCEVWSMTCCCDYGSCACS